MPRALLIGATGMVGGEVLRQALAGGLEVVAIGRRRAKVDHPRLTQIEHPDLFDYGPVAAALAGIDRAFFCLGAYAGALSKEEFRRITVDAVVVFARALHAASPNAVVCLLSGQGADPRERSPMAFARHKGAAENALGSQGFARVHVFRPGYIYPSTPRTEPNFGYRVMRALYPALRVVYPNIGLDSASLARAMLRAAEDGAEEVLENREIRRLAEGAKIASRTSFEEES